MPSAECGRDHEHEWEVQAQLQKAVEMKRDSGGVNGNGQTQGHASGAWNEDPERLESMS
jgi:hypothetical protein